jgi:hypothetical protein
MQHGPAASSGSNPKAPGSAGGYLPLTPWRNDLAGAPSGRRRDAGLQLRKTLRDLEGEWSGRRGNLD